MVIRWHDGLAHSLALLLGVGVGCASLPSTQLQTVGERQVECAQLDGARPVVVFEHGLAGSMHTWKKVFVDIARTHTVFAYNRPGYKKSDNAATPRDGAHIVGELRVLLNRRGLVPPYVLVGHSLGGLYMQLFARKYPDEVAALVLIDSLHPTQFEGKGGVRHQAWWFRMLFKMFITGHMRKEFDAATQTGQEILSLPTVTGKPVTIVTATDKSDSEAARFANEKRDDLARLYPGCRHVRVNSGHNIHTDNPSLVIDAIRGVLDRLAEP